MSQTITEMRIIIILTSVIIHNCLANHERRSIGDQINLPFNKQFLEYLLNNADNVTGTILRGERGSTALLSQVRTTIMGVSTQAWFKCSRKFGISRDVFAKNFRNYLSHTNAAEMCAMSCYMEENKVITDRKLNQAMISLFGLMMWGGDHDVLSHLKELLQLCNEIYFNLPDKRCKYAQHLDCMLYGLQMRNVVFPSQILHKFTIPEAMA